MKKRNFLILLLLSGLWPVIGVSAQDVWKITAGQIEPSSYYGITVANGMLGLVSSPEPLKISRVVLGGLYDIYGKDATHPERYAWACARFPQCDSYVSTIKGSTKPAGTLADAQLRHERIEAHRVINKVVESGMDQHSVYRYLEDRMGLQRDQLHIASSGIYYCRLVQQILKSLLERRCGTC